MSRSLPHKMFTLMAVVGLAAILLACFAYVAQAGSPAKVTFETVGLPPGLSLTVSGWHTNPGGIQPLFYTTTFTSNGPSVNVTSEANSIFTFTFPASIPSGEGTFSLISTSRGSPFTLGASGSTISIEATYAACSAISIDTQPSDVTAEYGSPATFSVAVTGLTPEYQWRRNEVDIPGANSSSYTISSVGWLDHRDSFDVVVTNDCSSVQSEAATLTVTRKSQEINFSQPATPKAYQASFGVSATSTSGLPVYFSVMGGCSLTGSTVTMTSGTTACVITASQCGNIEYSAAPDVVRTVNAAKLDQAIDFSEPASPQTYGDKFSVSPISDSGLAVNVNASGSCSYAAGEVTMTRGTGNCTLTASQAGDENYNPASDVSWTVTAAKASQSINFAAPVSPAAYGSQFAVNPSASSGLAVNLAASGGCTKSDLDITMTSSTQACTLTASQAGDDNYSAATDVTWTVAAAKAGQAITFAAPSSPAAYRSQFTVNPSASSGLAVTLAASGGCTKAGSLVTMTSSTQACTLTASQAGDDNYNPAADVTRTVEAAKADQTITFAAPASPQTYGAQFSVSPTATSNLVVNMDASGSCTYAAGTVTMTSGTGDCTLTASQTGDANYNPAPNITWTVAAVKADQVIIFAQPTSPVVAGSSFEISPTADSGLAVSVIATGACSLSGGTVTVSWTPGACTLTASQAGNDFYNAAPNIARTLEVKFKSGQIFIPILYSR